MGLNIALDGPSGAGKSSLAKALAKDMNLLYLDTGALYRAIGLYGLRHNADTKSASEIVPLLVQINIVLKRMEGSQHVFLNGEDVTTLIRTQDVSMAASNVSSIAQVRTFLLDLQRDVAKKENVVMDGRDIGTVVLPNAEVKIFLTAAAEIRDERRYHELLQRGMLGNYTKEDILKQIQERDLQDSTRLVAPLKCAADAIVLDNSSFTFEQTVEAAKEIIRSRIHV